MIKWSDKFSVGNQEIDDQHKKLIEIMEEVFYISSSKDYGITNLISVVNGLEDYIEEHLKYEEGVMKQLSYPQSIDHLKQHDALREKIKSFDVFDSEKANENVNEMLKYLMDWLVAHILDTDKKFSAFIAQNSNI